MLNRLWFNRSQVLVLAFVWLLLDQAIKAWVQAQLLPSEPLALWPGVFQITLVYNTGAAFSMLEQHPALLLGVTIALFFILLFFAFRQAHIDKLWLMAYSLVLGGALGNIVDRISLGKVVDYLDFVLIQYPVFNFADTCIFIGVALLIIRQLRTNF